MTQELEVKDIYKEQYAHFRSMNDILYKIPPLFTLAIGGLWYFASSQIQKDKVIASAVFIFTALLCICFVNVMARFGAAFSAYISNLNRLDGPYAVTIGSRWSISTVKTVQLLLLLSMLMSIGGAVYSWTADKTESAQASVASGSTSGAER